MKVINNFKHNYEEDPIRFFNFEEFEERAKDYFLYIGGWPDESIYNEDSSMPKIFFSTEEQVWQQDGTNQYIPYVEKILTICPERFTNRQKRQTAFFPLNSKFIPECFDKQYEVIYTGCATGSHIHSIIDVIKDYNYRLVSFGDYNGITTNKTATYRQKLDLIAKTKICITHNLTNNSPQLKSRCFEAAFCKSIMLVLYDDFNIVEDWFVPDQDFLYFKEGELKNTLDKVLQNYDKYKTLAENAYKKAIENYTTEKFIERYIGWK